MLGKASEIKVTNPLQNANELRKWLEHNQDALVISIQATADEGNDYFHVIYKEPEQTEETPIKPRESVQWFAEVMENKLRENDHKGGWDECNIDWLIHRLYQEAEELWREVRSNDKNYQNIISESADVADFAMMIADKARKEAKP